MTFESKRLGELCTKITDGSHYSPKEVVGGVPMYSVKDMTEFGFSDKSVKRISEEEYEALVKADSTPRLNDVLIAKDGSVLKHVFAIESEIKGALLSSVAILRPNLNYIDSNFLVYALQDPILQNDVLSNYVSGSGVPRIVLKDFKNISIKTPPLEIQKKISVILKSLDKRIQLNLAVSQSLEDIAQTIFKSWFIDFDPVKAKMAGETPAGMDTATAALFPDSFEKTELGLIPSGWKATKLSSSLKLSKSTVKAGPFTEYVPYVPIDQIGARDIFLKNSMHGFEAKTSLVSFKKDDILFGAMRPYFHKVVLAPFDGTTRTTTFVLRAINPHYLSHSLFTVYQESAVAYATNNSQGTTIPYAVWNNSFEDLPIILPPEPIAKAFNDIVLPMLQFGYSLIAQNRSLVEIRDGLLPRLISGDLQIPEEMLAS